MHLRQSTSNLTAGKRSCSYWPLTSRIGIYLLIFITLVVLMELWYDNATNLEENSSQFHRKSLLFNEEMAQLGVNYPVCSRLASLFEELEKEEMNRVNEEKRYTELLEKGELNCGVIRVGFGILKKRYRYI